MPVYTLPQFNLLCDVYTAIVPPPVGPITFANVPCQLYVSSKYPGGATPPNFLRMPYNPAMVMMGPQPWVALGGHYVNVPVGSNMWYEVQQAYVVHRGFSNQYIQCTMLQLDPGALPAYQYWSAAPL